MIQSRPMGRKLVVSLLAAAVLFSQPQTTAPVDDGVVSLRVRFGVTDTAPSTWDGSVAVTGGEIVSMRDWHPRAGDRVGKADWSLATRKSPNFTLRPWEAQRVVGP